MSRLIKDMFKREEISVAHEMIEQQHNDYVVSALNELFEDLIQNVNNNKNIKKASDLHKDQYCLNILNKIDYTLKERFGIETKFVAVDNGWNCGVLVSSPRDIHVIENDMFSETLDGLKEIIDTYNVNESNAKAKNQVQEMTFDTFSGKDNLAMAYNYRKSILALRDKMKTSSIIIDRKKAKIIGLPNDFIAYLQHDLVSFIRKLKLDAGELTAVMLHEIGHAFTHIEYSYRSVTNTSVLIDTFLENVTKKNKTPKESLILAYEKVSGDTSSDYKTKDSTTAIVYMLDSFLKENRFTITGTANPSVDSEQLADQFAGRFGLSAQQASLEKKVYDVIKEGKEKLGWSKPVFASYVVASGVIMILMVAIGLAAVSVILGIILFLNVVLRAVIKDTNIYDTDPGYTAKYDDVKRRVERQRNEAIRRLRTLDSTNKLELETEIAAVTKIDEVLKALPDAKVPLFDKVLRTFSSTTKHRLEIRTIERMIEDLSENNLYLASAKLQSKI